MVSTAFLHSFVDDKTKTSLTRALVRRQCHQRWRIMNHESRKHLSHSKIFLTCLDCNWTITRPKPPPRAACIGKHWSQGGGNIVESLLREVSVRGKAKLIRICMWFSRFPYISSVSKKGKVKDFAYCFCFWLIGWHHEGARLFSAPCVLALACSLSK